MCLAIHQFLETPLIDIEVVFDILERKAHHHFKKIRLTAMQLVGMH